MTTYKCLCALLCLACSCSSSEASFMSTVGAAFPLTMEGCNGNCPLFLNYGPDIVPTIQTVLLSPLNHACACDPIIVPKICALCP